MSISCANQIKQIGLASSSYSTDYNSFFVPAFQFDGVEGPPYWFERLASGGYASKKLFKCPSQKRGYFFCKHNLSYGWNYMALFRKVGWRCRRYIEARHPSKTIVLSDSNGDINADCFIRSNVSTQYPGTRHNEGANTLFVDGHVNHERFNDLISPSNSSWWAL